ncbi:replication protein A 70 kDa DNA-binding subunit B-like [Chenopodium quinoa]|uniref:replication protein A 70 kDa DNA-binding subunit B-like n=1 Tax=Chenopodium quinoa TaxID=63459 RepID=UPI000B78612E|nr:replication protein A 70 kDa DNA-binding subunit B-like [Chenopodium quinoa]
MTIGRQTVIQRLDSETGPIVPKYQPLFTIPRAVDPDGRYDVVAIVLFVEDQPQMIPNIRGRDSPVREIYQERPITISAWNDLAGKECDALCTWAEKFNVIGFTALKSRMTKATGFSLNTTMSTRIIHEPKGDKADVLREWAKMYPQMLLGRQEKVLNVRYPNTVKNVVTIAELRARKAIHTMQNEIARIKVTIPEPEMERLNAYVGCQGCGKRTNIPVGTSFPCNACRKRDSVSSHRVIFKFECSDESGTMTFTTFNDATEKLFRKSSTEIFNIKTTEDVEAFRKRQEKLSTKPFIFQVTPSQELETNNVLIWTLKDVEIIDDVSIPEVANSAYAELSHPLMIKPSDKGKGIEHELLLETEAHGKKTSVLGVWINH